ncbi:D-glycero-beta-D-manno-heptose 1,7-bisphosphate 7-phosphatase [Saccharobesus litoralis]|uniref:D-glycero-beta-D-manno-heptose 1,7-bisphosphate 7-phosphatase n=1 Tax=Saccharobesus litoralis TaxID=2172099 RepID=UPI001E28442D|nr:D-glycero-beta-D-manno-heptose 1,7-bisphosphate 7-phosphatase [Saccharobesus litoralis]
MAKNKALFLDRDGVINFDHGYVSQIDQFEFIDGIFEICQAAQAKGYSLIIVTNQSGIGRGYFSQHDFDVLTEWMVDQFAANDVQINDIMFCPHHPEKAVNEYKTDCDCRKPKPGMILEAAQRQGINIAKSIMIGDKISDMKAADLAGVGTRILLDSHYSRGQDDLGLATHRIEALNEIFNLGVLN